MTSGPERPATTSHGWWKCRALGPDTEPVWLAQVGSSLHTDDVVVELPEQDATALVGEDAVCVARYSVGEVTRLEVTPRGGPKAPPLWFAELPDADAAPPAVVLIAFSGHDVPAGSLLAGAPLEAAGVVSSDQLGAVRWYPATGEVDQIYVAPNWRRRSIGSALIAAGATLSVARGWPRLWGDGQRTALGDRWRSASPWAHRAAPLTHLAPPMTPFDQR